MLCCSVIIAFVSQSVCGLLFSQERDLCVDATVDEGDEQNVDDETAQQDTGDTVADESNDDEEQVMAVNADDDEGLLLCPYHHSPATGCSREIDP